MHLGPLPRAPKWGWRRSAGVTGERGTSQAIAISRISVATPLANHSTCQETCHARGRRSGRPKTQCRCRRRAKCNALRPGRPALASCSSTKRRRKHQHESAGKAAQKPQDQKEYLCVGKPHGRGGRGRWPTARAETSSADCPAACPGSRQARRSDSRGSWPPRSARPRPRTTARLRP